MLKYLIYLTFFLLSQGALAQLNKNGLGLFYHGQGAGRTPPAALIRFEGQSLDSKAYAVGCGHCNQMPKGSYVLNKKISNAKIYLYDSTGRQRSLAVKKIVYGTQTKVDLLLLELELTYNEIFERYTIQSRIISSQVYNYGTPIYFYNLEGTQSCDIDQINSPFVISEDGTDFLEDAYVYFKCISQPGYSGSILVSKISNEVIGLNVGGFPIDNHPSEKYVSYGSSVHQLKACMNSEFIIDLEKPGCVLKFDKPKADF